MPLFGGVANWNGGIWHYEGSDFKRISGKCVDDLIHTVD